MSDFLNVEGKTFLVLGVANKKSVAYHIAKALKQQNARVLLSVRNRDVLKDVRKLFADEEIFTCDVEHETEVKQLAENLKAENVTLDGMVHSIAFANYSEGFKPFHETEKKDFLQAADISCFSLVNLSRHLADIFNENASVVTISISSTRVTAENYGYMAPIKAALDSAVCFLAKSFSAKKNIRFNSVNPGLLKTSSSAGIPGYVDSYLFAEKLTLRKKNLSTREVAGPVLFLLSEQSSGINAQSIVIDAGMGVNFFDREIVEKATR